MFLLLLIDFGHKVSEEKDAFGIQTQNVKDIDLEWA